MAEESPFAGLPKAQLSPFAGLPQANPFSDLPRKKTTVETFMEKASGVFSRVGAEFSKGFDPVIEEEGFGLTEEAEGKLKSLGLLPDTGALKTINRTILEGPAQALELVEATFMGALRGGAQVLREFGASDTTARQLMRDVFALTIGAAGGAFKGRPAAASTPAIVKAVTFYDKPDELLAVSTGLGTPMVGIANNELAAEQKLAARGW